MWGISAGLLFAAVGLKAAGLENEACYCLKISRN
jgi:hypothetical protein